MRPADRWVWRWLICGLVVVPAAGCALVASLFDPNLAVGFGLDSASVNPPQGVVIVAFKNDTGSAATFTAFTAADASALSYGRTFSVEVQAGSVGNEVLDCPVGIISPGSLGASAAIDTSSAAVVQVDTTATSVAYAGQPLQLGTAFVCGDVVEVRLSTIVAAGGAQGGATQEYSLTVRVIPGR